MKFPRRAVTMAAIATVVGAASRLPPLGADRGGAPAVAGRPGRVDRPSGAWRSRVVLGGRGVALHGRRAAADRLAAARGIRRAAVRFPDVFERILLHQDGSRRVPGDDVSTAVEHPFRGARGRGNGREAITAADAAAVRAVTSRYIEAFGRTPPRIDVLADTWRFDWSVADFVPRQEWKAIATVSLDDGVIQVRNP